MIRRGMIKVRSENPVRRIILPSILVRGALASPLFTQGEWTWSFRTNRRRIASGAAGKDIGKRLKDDERGIRYRVEGPAKDGRMMCVICRFRADSDLVIVTVYALTE